MTENEKVVLRAIKGRVLDTRANSRARSLTMRLEEADTLLALIDRLTHDPDPVILDHEE